MVNLIYMIFCILSLININIRGFNSFFYDYLDIENTKSIKGIFVWMIFFRHCTSYYKKRIKKGKISILIDKSFGQNIVSLFLFYSGFGINESFKKKGNKYIKTLPIKSFIIFIKSQIILILFLFNNIILGIKISFRTYMKSIIFKTGIGNSNWFAFTIITIYIHSFLSFILIKKKYNFLGIIIISIICYFHILIVYKYYYRNLIYSVDTIICFVFGFYYSFFNIYFDKIIMKNDIMYFGIMIFSILGYYKYYIIKQKNLFNISIKNCLFTFIVVLITMKIKFKNELLNLLNTHSYSIYLLQRLVMIYITKKGYFTNNEFIGFFIEFLLVILISTIFDKYTICIDNLLRTKNIKKTESMINNSKIVKNNENYKTLAS